MFSFSERQCPLCLFKTCSIQEYKLHHRTEHGDEAWCGYGCQFKFPLAAAYLYRRHLRESHDGVFRRETTQQPRFAPPSVTVVQDVQSTAIDDNQPTLVEDNQPNKVEDNQSTVDEDVQPTLVSEPAFVEEEGVENILKELLPPGCLSSPQPCLSPLPTTPPKKVRKLYVTKSEFMSPPAEGPLTSEQRVIPTSPQVKPAETKGGVIDARCSGNMTWRLIPVDIPYQSIQPRGRDPRVEALILRRAFNK